MVTAPVIPVVQSAVTTIAHLPLVPLSRLAASQTMFGQQPDAVLEQEDIALLRALSCAPDNIFPQEEKERLKLVFDIDAEERKLQTRTAQEGVKMETDYASIMARIPG